MTKLIPLLLILLAGVSFGYFIGSSQEITYKTDSHSIIMPGTTKLYNNTLIVSFSEAELIKNNLEEKINTKFIPKH
jgi:hypothetical protein